MPLAQLLAVPVPPTSDKGAQTTYGSFTLEAEKEISGMSRTLSFGVSALCHEGLGNPPAVGALQSSNKY
jgi:hypothetical protein